MLWFFTLFFTALSVFLLVLLYRTFDKLDDARATSRWWMAEWQDCDETLRQQLEKEHAVRRTHRSNMDQIRREYQALEAGNFELADSYEQQFLSFKETIGQLCNGAEADRRDIRRLIRIVARHDEKCLPTLDFQLSDDIQEMLANWRTYSDPSPDE